ncbi:MAG: NAD-dependent epimerase/dehydratase family protein [Actinophytocola sp.]|uniref:NAD-dependent epimerase/dehydratase family protein n=1 Tax=Actinophytocola sp. TaxID=1872138 RepID=UPI003C76F6C8
MRECPAAVIGATGFIGSRLMPALTGAGHPVAWFNSARPPVAHGRAAPGLCEAETVFFLAARLNPLLAERQPDQVVAERRLLNTVLAELARCGRRPVFVLASSGGTVYGLDAAPPFAESAPTGPTSAYGRAKLQLERDLLGHADAVQPVVMRLSNVYGPSQQPEPGYGVLAHWLTAAVRNEPIQLFGDPRVVRDYVYVDDVASVLEAVHRRVAAGTADGIPDVANVGSGVPTSLAELLDTVAAVVGRELVVTREGGRQFDQRGNYLDSSLAHATLDWRATTTLTDGVRQCWDHILARHVNPTRV